MVEIHNKSTYDCIYSKFTEDFITAYCQFRSNGYKARDSLTAATMSIQNQVATLIVKRKNRHKATMIISAYQNLKKDTDIVEKAIKYYQGIK